MEILLTLEAAIDWNIVDQSNIPETASSLELGLSYHLEAEGDDIANELNMLSTSPGGLFNPLARIKSGAPLRHTRSLSSGCDFKSNSKFLNHGGRLNVDGFHLRIRR